MATITTIDSGDQISNSRTDINNNFANLNSDKIETSVLDTDTAMAANSDAKIPSQKAVKAYIDTSGGANASETVRGIVEEATDAEVTAGTATGATGAKLFVTPAKLATRTSTLFPTSATFTDDFGRSDRELNGDNGWTVRRQDTGAATNSIQEVDNTRAEALSATGGFAVQTLTAAGHQFVTFPLTLSCDMGMQSNGRAWNGGVIFGSSSVSPATLTAFQEAGISVRLTRSDSIDTSSDLSIYDGATLVAQDTDIGFDFGSVLSFELTIAADGSGSVVIYDAAGLTGTSDTLSWTSRNWVEGKGNHAGFYLRGVGIDGLGESNQMYLDNFTLAYKVTY